MSLQTSSNRQSAHMVGAMENVNELQTISNSPSLPCGSQTMSYSHSNYHGSLVSRQPSQQQHQDGHHVNFTYQQAKLQHFSEQSNQEMQLRRFHHHLDPIELNQQLNSIPLAGQSNYHQHLPQQF